MPLAASTTKTSEDILNERNVLHTRVEVLETALCTVRDETEHAMRFPQLNFLTLCRIAAVARRAVGERAEVCEADEGEGRA